MSNDFVKTWFAVLGYGTCSSLMLVVNKLAVHHLPAPSFVLLAQFFCSWFAVKVCGMCGLIVVDRLEWAKLRAFLPISLAFLAAVFANVKTLQFANVETFIVFRASTPLTVSICEWLCLGRELPNLRSTLCLVVLLAGAAAYVLTDAHFVVHGYIWVGVWYFIFCFDQLYIKHAVDNVEVESNWGRVFYTNLWACGIAGTMTAATEPQMLLTFHWSRPAIGMLAVSCLLGVAISYFAFLCRAQVSATHFTVIGNVCKVVTVFINVFIWDKHATPTGLGCLSVCLVAGFFYQPSPKRNVSASDPEAEKLVTSSKLQAGPDCVSGDESVDSEVQPEAKA